MSGKGEIKKEKKEGKIKWTKWIKGGWKKQEMTMNECTLIWKEWVNEKNELMNDGWIDR